jgi:Protein of unknown function (DUF2752)
MHASSQTVPPKISAPPSLGIFAAVTLVLAGIIAGAVLFFFNPSKYSFYPVCQFHQLTGLNCPGCGSTRAAYQLLHGHFSAALHDNALFVLALAALAARSIWFLKRKSSNRTVNFFLPPKALWTFLVIALVFTVLRNLPAFSFLSP